jgi:hypothetical protein
MYNFLNICVCVYIIYLICVKICDISQIAKRLHVHLLIFSIVYFTAC